jgi:talin
VNRQEDLLVAANLGRKATSDLLSICKASIQRTHDRTLHQRTLENGRLCVKSYQALLETIHRLIDKPSNEIKQNLIGHSRMITQAIQELVHCAESWKGFDSNETRHMPLISSFLKSCLVLF